MLAAWLRHTRCRRKTDQNEFSSYPGVVGHLPPARPKADQCRPKEKGGLHVDVHCNIRGMAPRQNPERRKSQYNPQLAANSFTRYLTKAGRLRMPLQSPEFLCVQLLRQSYDHDPPCRRCRLSHAFEHVKGFPTRPHLLRWAKYEARCDRRTATKKKQR